MTEASPQLRRSLSLPLICLYGLGNILGAGIYVLIGKVASEAVYVQHGFGIKQLSLTVGLLIVLTGIVSAATIARGFVAYLDVFISLPA